MPSPQDPHPALTMLKASSVPMFTSSESWSMGNTAGRKATIDPTTMFEIHGVRNLGWISLAHLGSRPSRDMEKKTRDWPSSITSITVARPKTAPTFTSRLPHATPVDIDAHRHRVAYVQRLVAHQSGQRQRDHDVQDGADHQRAQDADRHIALRILRLLRRRRYSVEADIRKEDRAAPAAMPLMPKFPASSLGGMNGCQFIFARSG